MIALAPAPIAAPTQEKAAAPPAEEPKKVPGLQGALIAQAKKKKSASPPPAKAEESESPIDVEEVLVLIFSYSTNIRIGW